MIRVVWAVAPIAVAQRMLVRQTEQALARLEGPDEGDEATCAGNQAAHGIPDQPIHASSAVHGPRSRASMQAGLRGKDMSN